MIRTENVTIGGREFVHTWSDEWRDLRQEDTGLIFSEAYDLVDAPHAYTETGDAKEISDAEALSIITGGEYGKEGGAYAEI